VLMLAASGVPSPLYRVYQQEFGFSSGVLTTVFGVYAADRGGLPRSCRPVPGIPRGGGATRGARRR